MKIDCPLTLSDRLIEWARPNERSNAQPMMRGRVVWIQLNRPPKFPRRPIEVEVVGVENLRQRGVRFGQRVVERERLFRSYSRGRKRFLWTPRTEVGEKRVRIG